MEPKCKLLNFAAFVTYTFPIPRAHHSRLSMKSQRASASQESFSFNSKILANKLSEREMQFFAAGPTANLHRKSGRAVGNKAVRYEIELSSKALQSRAADRREIDLILRRRRAAVRSIMLG